MNKSSLKAQDSKKAENVEKKMRKKASAVMIALLFFGMFMLAFNVQQAKAKLPQVVYINADGSITPVEAPIVTSDNITYSFTGDIYYPSYFGIEVERDNIIIDGSRHTLQGPGGSHVGASYGIELTRRSNVTVKNVQIKGWYEGISLTDSSFNNISRNEVADSSAGIMFEINNSNNIVLGNNITRSHPLSSLVGWEGFGIVLSYNSTYNLISGNNIWSNAASGIRIGMVTWVGSGNNTYNRYNSISRNSIIDDNAGIVISSSTNNTISENDIAWNLEGIELGAFQWGQLRGINPNYNLIYHNNFVNNTFQVNAGTSLSRWDDGYPSGGNYWSDYKGVDSDRDGIGDTPYAPPTYMSDNYPLMYPWNATWSPKPSLRVPPLPTRAFWMEWWFWTIILVGTAVSVSAVYFLRKRKPSVSTGARTDQPARPPAPPTFFTRAQR